MLLFDDTSFKVGGASIFPDHSDPRQFWYLPTEVRLAERDGVPVFTLLKYRNRASQSDKTRGGGFLTFEVNLRLTEEQQRDALKLIKRSLTTHGIDGDPVLSPVPFETGTVKAVALDLGGDKVIGAASPSLYGDNTAMFSLTLDEKYITILEDVFNNQDSNLVSPIGVIFDMEFRALRPRLQFTATAEIDRVMEEFKVGLSASLPIYGIHTRAEVQAGIRKLVEDGVVSIESTMFDDSDDVEKLRNQAMDYFTDTMLTEFFVPQLAMAEDSGKKLDLSRFNADQLGDDDDDGASSNQSQGNSNGQDGKDGEENKQDGEGQANDGGGDDDGTVEDLAEATTGIAEQILPSVNFKFEYTKTDEQRTRTYTYNDSKAQAMKYYPQGFFTLLLDGVASNLVIREIDLDDEFFRLLTINVESTDIDFDVLKMHSANVEIEYDGRQPDGDNDGIFKPNKTNPQTYRFYLNDDLLLDYRYNVEYNFLTQDSGELTTYKTDWITSRDRSLLLNPYQDLGFSQLEVSLEDDFQWNGIKSVIAHVTYEGPSWEDADKTWSLSKMFMFRPGGQTRYDWLMRLSNPKAKAFSYYFEYVLEDGNHSKTDPETSNVAAVLVPDLISAKRDIDFIFNLNFDETAYLTVNYNDSFSGYHWSKELVGKDDQKVSVSIPLANQENRAFSYVVTVVNNLTNQVQETKYPAGEYSRVVRVESLSDKSTPITITANKVRWSDVNRADFTVRYTSADGSTKTNTVKFESPDDEVYSFAVASGDGTPSYEWFATFYTDNGTFRYPQTADSYQTSTDKRLEFGVYAPISDSVSVLFDPDGLDWTVLDYVRVEVVDGSHEVGPDRGTKEREKMTEFDSEFEWEPNTLHQSYEWKVRFRLKEKLNGEKNFDTEWKSERFDDMDTIDLIDVFESVVPARTGV